MLQETEAVTCLVSLLLFPTLCARTQSKHETADGSTLCQVNWMWTLTLGFAG